MGFFSELFRSKKIDPKELENTLEELGNSIKKQQIRAKKLIHQQEYLLQLLKKARQSGESWLFDQKWKELQKNKLELMIKTREIQILSSEEIVIEKYSLSQERISRQEGQNKAHQLIQKIKKSGVDIKEAKVQIEEQEYIEELDAILNIKEISNDYPLEIEDENKDLFIQELDEIITMEKRGDTKEVERKTQNLQNKWKEGEIKNLE